MTTKHRWPWRLWVLGLAVLILAACGRGRSQPTAQPSLFREPDMVIDPTKIYLATLKTEKGDIKIELFADKAPKTVNNFIVLARRGYYDNTTFHRVLPDFIAQGGDPTGTGHGGPGYTFEDELDPRLRFDGPGYLAMANSGPNTNGSQFFITFTATPHLNGRHTIFGKVVEGMDVLRSLRPRDPSQNPDYTGDVLKTVVIEEIPQSLLPPPPPTPVPTVPVLAEGRPLAQLAIAERENLYTGKPPLVIDPTKVYIATIETTKGRIVAELYPADAPESVNNFYVLANLGYWDGFPLAFAQADAFVLTGSPAGDPTSDIGYGVPPERKRANVEGAVGYWFRPEYYGSSGSQFYILLSTQPAMNVQYTTFGNVIAGLDVARSLTTEDTIERITVAEK